jgi:hypothetical protein
MQDEWMRISRLMQPTPLLPALFGQVAGVVRLFKLQVELIARLPQFRDVEFYIWTFRHARVVGTTGQEESQHRC